MRYKVLYVACDFSEKDKNGQKSFDRQSFENYINTPETKGRIKNGRMLGSISHLSRDEYFKYINEIDRPSVGDQADYLLAKNLAATVITDMYVKDNFLYIWIETLPTTNGEMLAKFLDIGYDIPVSMSTSLEERDGKYHICEVFGLDVTYAPAFSTSVQQKEKIIEGSKRV